MDISPHIELLNLSKGSELLLKERNNRFIFFIKTGTVKIITHPNNYIKDIIGKGQILGELNLIEFDTETEKDQFNNLNERAVALEDTVTFVIKAQTMKSLIDKHSSLQEELLQLFNSKVNKLESYLENLLYKDGKTRIVEYLFYYLSEFGIEKENRLEAKKLLSNSDIAHLTKTSRQTVNSIMIAMRKKGIIEYDSKKICRAIKI